VFSSTLATFLRECRRLFDSSKQCANLDFGFWCSGPCNRSAVSRGFWQFLFCEVLPDLSKRRDTQVSSESWQLSESQFASRDRRSPFESGPRPGIVKDDEIGE
jgi:hypothetical protein